MLAPTMVGLLAALTTAADTAPVVAGREFLLIRRDPDMRLVGRATGFVYPVQLVEIDDRTLVHGDARRGYRSVALSEVVGLVATDALPAVPRTGLVRLGDGQRFPGQALSGARVSDDVLVWNQSAWLGRMEIPLNRIASVAFRPGAAIPDPGQEDVVMTGNGDRLDGFITALGDPLVIDLMPDEPGGERHRVELALDRVTAVRMVTAPHRTHGQRLWLIDGTVVDVERIIVDDEGLVRLEGLPFVNNAETKQLELAAMVAAQFDAEGLVAFSTLEPRNVQGPVSRYVIPHPVALDELAPLGLARIELRGPIVARYNLPSAPIVFSAQARLPVHARSWGDCELVLRSNRRVVFRAHLSAATPTVDVSVLLESADLEIEITEGAHGPIQDHVVLHRAMLLSPSRE